MASFCRSSFKSIANRSKTVTRKALNAKPTPSLFSAPPITRPLPIGSRVLGSLESMMPLHTAIASARLISNIAVDSSCWSWLSQEQICRFELAIAGLSVSSLCQKLDLAFFRLITIFSFLSLRRYDYLALLNLSVEQRKVALVISYMRQFKIVTIVRYMSVTYSVPFKKSSSEVFALSRSNTDVSLRNQIISIFGGEAYFGSR
ncbi:hypothetical protein ACFE04_021963 [Oxalis oulophora]